MMKIEMKRHAEKKICFLFLIVLIFSALPSESERAREREMERKEKYVFYCFLPPLPRLKNVEKTIKRYQRGGTLTGKYSKNVFSLFKKMTQLTDCPKSPRYQIWLVCHNMHLRILTALFHYISTVGRMLE